MRSGADLSNRRLAHEAALDGVADQVGGAAETSLQEDAGAVSAHGFHADFEAFGDGFDGEPRGDHAQDLEFSIGEAFMQRSVAAAADVGR